MNRELDLSWQEFLYMSASSGRADCNFETNGFYERLLKIRVTALNSGSNSSINGKHLPIAHLEQSQYVIDVKYQLLPST